MMNSIDRSGDDPLTNMALAVMTANSVWFAYWCWTMDAYRLGIYTWGYPNQHIGKAVKT